MTDNEEKMRPIIAKAAVVCLAIAIAPWLSGGQEPVGLLLSGFALLLGSLLVWKQPQSRVLRRGPMIVAYSLLIGLALLSLIWSANRYSSAIWIIEWVMAGLAFRLAYAVSGSVVGRKWLIYAYLISATIFSLGAIGMYLFSDYGRLTGTFFWANPAAAYLIPAIVLGLDNIRRGIGREQFGWAALTGLFGSAFWLTDSRAATAVLGLIILLFMLTTRPKKSFWILFVFSIILAYGASYGIVRLSSISQHRAKLAPGSRYAEAAKGESTSGTDRIFYLQSAIDIWLTHPIGGVGAGTYGDVHPKYQRRVVSASTSAHNVYAQVLAELGIAGFLLLVSLLTLLMVGVTRGLFGSTQQRALALGTLGLLLHFGLDIDARYPALLSLVGVFLGCLYYQSPRRWVKLRFGWPLVSAVLLIPIISLYFSETWATRGQVAQQDGDYALAADDYAQASTGIIYNPDHLEAEGINRFVLASTGGSDIKTQIDLALESARKAQTMDPYDGQHHQLEGRILAFRGDLKAAEGAFRRALELDAFNHPDYSLDLASVQVREGNNEAALKTANEMLAQYSSAVIANRAADQTLAPTLANLEALTGNIYLGAGRIDEANIAADKALLLDPQGLRGRALKHKLSQ